MEQKIFAVGEDRFKGQMLSMKDQVMEAIESIEKLYERKGGITGISTGFVEFDRMTSGMHPSEMIVIAARPSMGKTALAMNIAEHVAIDSRLAVGVFSLEMTADSLVLRMLCSRSRVNLRNVREGFLADLLLVDGDPVADVSLLQHTERLVAIVKGGDAYKLDRDALEHREVRAAE